MKTEFHKLLKKAVSDDTALICVIEKIMPMINNFSRISNGKIDLLNIALMTISTIIYITIVLKVIIKQYKSEDVLF